MPLWGNTDAPATKPKSPQDRQVREKVQLSLYSQAAAGQNTVVLAYNDGAQNNVANVGVAVGQYIYFYPNGAGSYGGLAGNGYPGMFVSNNAVKSISGNTVTLTSNVFITTSAGALIEFDNVISYNSNKSASYNVLADTVLVTPTRLATGNINASMGGNFNSGWVKIQKKINNDGTVRYLRETMVALANPVASNTLSGNTSWGQAFANT